MVRLNVGLEARPLAKVASGGELSRIMLALKVVLAKHDAIPTLVFDEVDQGIGGEVGAEVGDALAEVAAAAPGAGDHPPAADRRAGRPAPGRLQGGTRGHRDQRCAADSRGGSGDRDRPDAGRCRCGDGEEACGGDAGARPGLRKGREGERGEEAKGLASSPLRLILLPSTNADTTESPTSSSGTSSLCRLSRSRRSSSSTRPRSASRTSGQARSRGPRGRRR